MNTVYGVLADDLGHCFGDNRDWPTPADMVNREQGRIPIDLEHNGSEVGEVVFLELDRLTNHLWAVAEVDDTVSPSVPVRVGDEIVHVPHPLYFSAERHGRPGTEVAIRSVALTHSPARVAAQPVTFRTGDAHMAAYNASQPWERQLLHRAADTHRRGRPLTVHHQDDPLEVLERHAYGHTPTPSRVIQWDDEWHQPIVIGRPEDKHNRQTRHGVVTFT